MIITAKFASHAAPEPPTTKRETTMTTAPKKTTMKTKTRWVVTMTECGGRGRARECGVIAADESAARRTAVGKLYPGAYWAADHGLGDNYGQVVGAGGHCLTDRVRIDCGSYATTVRHTADGSGWVRT